MANSFSNTSGIQIDGLLALKTRVKSKTSYFLTVFALALTYLYYGYSLVAFGTIFDNVAALFGWNSPQQTLFSSIISGMIFAGQILGSVVATYLSHWIGRQNLTLCMILVAYVGMALTAVENIGAMIIGRLIANLSTGVFSTISPIIGREISPREYSSLSSAVIANFVGIGIFFGFVLGFGLPEPSPTQNSYWRLVTVAGAVPLTLAGLILIFNTKGDSGKYIYQRYRDEERARTALSRIYKEEEIDNELEAIKEEAKIVKPKIPFKMLCQTQKKQFALGYAIFISKICVGLNFTGVYCYMLLQRAELAAGATLEDARHTAILYSTIGGIAQVLGCFGSFYWLKEFRMKPLYLVIFGTGYLLTGLYCALGFLSIYYMQKYCLAIMFFVYGAGIGAYGFIYVPAIAIDSVFGIMLGSFSAMRLIDTLLFPFLTTSILEICGTMSIYWLIGMVANVYFMAKSVEIKGVSEADIYKQLSQSKHGDMDLTTSNYALLAEQGK